jgi:hypothetical protein
MLTSLSILSEDLHFTSHVILKGNIKFRMDVWRENNKNPLPGETSIFPIFVGAIHSRYIDMQLPWYCFYASYLLLKD